jgi:alcohol dehydrogenase
MSHSQAAIFSGAAGHIELRQISLPPLENGEILVRILGCTLCGSDLHTFEGRRQAPVPTVLGHEIVGQIEAVGGNVEMRDMAGNRLQSGDRVTWAIVANCGKCFFCQHDLPQKCQRSVKYGHESLQPGRELLGGLGEHCLLVPGTSIVRLPDDLPLEVACPANCATATAMAAVEAAGELQGSTVCILGAGLLGLTVSAIAKTRGAANIICVELRPERRDQARQFGVTHAIGPESLPETARQLTDGRGFDVLFELSGSSAAFTAAWPAAGIGGTFVAVGAVFPGPPVELHLEQLIRRHLTIRGIHNYAPKHLLQAVQFLENHYRTFPFANLVAEWQPLAQIAHAFEAARDPHKIRIGVRP